MAKPIFLVRVPADMPREKVISVSRGLAGKVTDWHILVIAADYPCSEPSFEAFSEKTATDIEIDELKELALKQFK